MSTLSPRPMGLVLVEFDELFARHLCRHSQSGINWMHLLALTVIWYAIYSLLFQIAEHEWVLAIPAILYLLALLPNVPRRVFGATVAYLALIIAPVVLIPQPPFWTHLIAIAVFYKVQSWSHLLFRRSFDMTAFDKKYKKGPVLFVVLLLYEVPIVLNYLLFAKDSSATEIPTPGRAIAHSPAP